MIIAVASGKGGTGKTTIAVNLALSLENVQFLDCDVEEPNAHIFLKPEITHTHQVNLPVPKVNEDRCSYCGKCAEVCAYNAIAVVKDHVLIFPELCHGCGGCSIFCPEDAIEEINRPIGVLEEGKSGSISFIDGKLNLGEALAVPVVRAVKKAGLGIRPNNDQVTSNNHLTIIDVPPGTSCPVVESVKGGDFCLLVTEPTPFGLNDLVLAVEVLRKLRIPFGVLINRADVGDTKVDEYCQREKIPILMRIPMDRNIAIAYSKGITMIEVKPEYKKKFIELYEKIEQLTSG
ncbi:(4Fe-4S)-binding protein [Candidatus Aerophobetes bacterium]|uniref:(4Fe-4S)-binding protein n=1 Tax=Aerophobetes bacterium TaxID=2030807 RepID=A0A523UKV4_UNCAE|nr:MAG: (4Fe-4S)-binding protein [Candidatus Aerophobetes bacterium]